MEVSHKINELKLVYNWPNQKLKLCQQADELFIGGYLKKCTLLKKFELRSALQNDSKNSFQTNRASMMLGVLHRLDAVLLTLEKIVDQILLVQKSATSADPILEYPKIIINDANADKELCMPPCLIGIRSARIEIEIEVFLQNGYSLLERIAQLISEEHSIKQFKHFNNFKNLKIEQIELKKIIDEAWPRFLGTIISDGKTKNLRNIFTHNNSLPEVSERAFSISRPTKDLLLAFDIEVNERPLISSIHALAQVLPWFTFEILRAILENKPCGNNTSKWAQDYQLTQCDFKPTWSNPFVHLSRFITQDEKGVFFNTINWIPGGVNLQTNKLKPEIFQSAVNPCLKDPNGKHLWLTVDKRQQGLSSS